MKNTIPEMKNTLHRINRKVDKAENWISDLEDKVGTKTPVQSRIKKKEFKLWWYIKGLSGQHETNNIYIIGIPEREEREQETENIFEEIMT